MEEIAKFQEQHSAGPQAIGFDYQFYYFVMLILELKTGQKIGFEIKDDIHIEKADGTIVLFQAKHTVAKKADGTSENLTALDTDLWKTLSNWTNLVKLNHEILKNHIFCLVANKSETTNKFSEALALFKSQGNTKQLLISIEELRDKAKDLDLKSNISNVLSLSEKKAKTFFQNLSVELDSSYIVERIKNKIREKMVDKPRIPAVFDSLISNLQEAKYLEILNRRKFELSFDEFQTKFGKCFLVGFDKKSLPKRQFNFLLPENIEEQIFIKQLIEIGDIENGASQIRDYTTQMLQTLNQFDDWSKNGFVLPTELDEFEKDSILIWDHEFRSRYRRIERELRTGKTVVDLQREIDEVALEILDYLRRKRLTLLGGDLDTLHSNGYYYSLSNIPIIGWHLEWERKHRTA